MEPTKNAQQGDAHLTVLQNCNGSGKPLGKEGTGSGSEGKTTKTTGGDSWL